MTRLAIAVLAVTVSTALATSSSTQENPLSGDWSLKLGGSLSIGPEYDGADSFRLLQQPLASFGRQGSERRFSSRNDNISIGLFDDGIVRAGPTAKLIFGRNEGTSDDLIGLEPIRFGVELGGFAEVYPADWLRLRGELRRGVRSHDAVVADFAADAFTNLTPTLQLSGGPRTSWASSDYADAFYGVSPAESLASGLTQYAPGSGFRSLGFGSALTWQATDAIETILFAEYARLVGPASESSLVQERGDANQFVVGVSATYQFDFSF